MATRESTWVSPNGSSRLLRNNPEELFVETNVDSPMDMEELFS